ncbi:hypothetical protein M5D96_001474 [Drosophila gunungcola]|uniref:Uncharacterized protein n=1 Tax=Drosophila gunungcola TaxID=103775 RepID=A0A9P9YY70_9MUSC|nr:hypothetical protein M5D96_001474 [Drosophila gunungcola]
MPLVAQLAGAPHHGGQLELQAAVGLHGQALALLAVQQDLGVLQLRLAAQQPAGDVRHHVGALGHQDGRLQLLRLLRRTTAPKHRQVDVGVAEQRLPPRSIASEHAHQDLGPCKKNRRAKGTGALVGHLDGHVEDDRFVEVAPPVGGQLGEPVPGSGGQLPVGTGDQLVAQEDKLLVGTQGKGGRDYLARDAQTEVAGSGFRVHRTGNWDTRFGTSGLLSALLGPLFMFFTRRTGILVARETDALAGTHGGGCRLSKGCVSNGKLSIFHLTTATDTGTN